MEYTWRDYPDSEVFDIVYWDAEEGLLGLVFKNGTVSIYKNYPSGFSPEDVKSWGKYYNLEIRDNWTHVSTSKGIAVSFERRPEPAVEEGHEYVRDVRVTFRIGLGVEDKTTATALRRLVDLFDFEDGEYIDLVGVQFE